MLPLALGIGEAEVDPVDLLVLDARKDSACVGCHGVLPSLFEIVTARTNAERRQAPAAATRIELGSSDSRRAGESQASRELFTRGAVLRARRESWRRKA